MTGHGKLPVIYLVYQRIYYMYIIINMVYVLIYVDVAV